MRRAERRASCLVITSPRWVLHHHPIAAADRRGGRDDHHVAIAEHRFHRVTADLQRIGVGIADLRQRDLIPAAADGVTAIVKEPVAAGLGEADQRDAPAGTAGGAIAGERAGAGYQRGEGLEARAGGVQHLRDTFGAGPPGAAVRHAALGGVEGGWIQPGALGEARGGQAILRGERVQRTPDVVMLHARRFRWRSSWSERQCRRIPGGLE